MTRAHGPVVTRRRLGGELKRLREQSGKKLEDVAKVLECSPSKISRLENGKGLPRWRDVRDLLDVYQVGEGEVRERLLQWAQTGQQPMWWSEYADVLGSAFGTYVELEWDASRICAYESHLVHGLLQTPDYAHAVLGAMGSADPERLERQVKLRRLRQQVLRPEHGLEFRCVLDESILYRVVSSPEVLRGQVEHLIEIAASDQIDVRILPFSAGPVGAFVESFAKLEFSEGLEHGVVHVERGEGPALFLDPEEVATYEARMARLLASTLREEDSIPLMQRAIDRL